MKVSYEKENENGKGILAKVRSTMSCYMLPNKKIGVSATDAFFRTKYGDIKSPEQYVEVAQSYIRRMIESRIDPYRRDPKDAIFRSYYCIVDFDSEMRDYMDKIFEPFKRDGYLVTKLSGRIEEIKNELVFIVSWDKRDGISLQESDKQDDNEKD